MAKWSRGMIFALGARGPGFKSRTGPVLSQVYHDLCKAKYLETLKASHNFENSMENKGSKVIRCEGQCSADS